MASARDQGTREFKSGLLKEKERNKERNKKDSRRIWRREEECACLLEKEGKYV
jgi:hypothetical protein